MDGSVTIQEKVLSVQKVEMQYSMKNGFMKIDTHWLLQKNGYISLKVIS